MPMGTKFGATIEVTKVAIRVPAVLEECDMLRSRGESSPLTTVIARIDKLTAVKDDLRACLESWHSDTDDLPYRVAPVSELQNPRMIGAEVHRLFPPAFVFPNSLIALKHRSYWVLLLALTQTQLELMEASPLLQNKDELAELKHTAQETADNLSMTVAFGNYPASGYVAMFSAMHPVHMASLWYSKKSDLCNLDGAVER